MRQGLQRESLGAAVRGHQGRRGRVEARHGAQWLSLAVVEGFHEGGGTGEVAEALGVFSTGRTADEERAARAVRSGGKSLPLMVQ